MTSASLDRPFISIGVAARNLGLPVRWLRDEIDAGRLPHVVTGAGVRVDVDLIRHAINDRSVAAVRLESGEAGR